MTCRVRLISAAGLCACVAGVMGAATAAKAYDAEYVFGDSLSDNGNAAEAGGVPYPNPPSYHYAYTNGPVAVADLAQSLGLPALEPSLWFNGFTDQHNLFPAGFTPGTNYAFAGATANLVGYTGFPPANLPEQVSAYTTHVSNIADKSALYVIMIGGNDVINAISSGFTDAYLTTGVDLEIAQITTLAGDGFELPDRERPQRRAHSPPVGQFGGGDSRNRVQPVLRHRAPDAARRSRPARRQHAQ